MKKYIALALLFFSLTVTSQAQSEPPFGMSHLNAYSIFYDNFRTGNYDMALMYGRWMLEAKPREIQGTRFTLDRHFERMIDVYAGMSKKQSDPSLRSAYLDTAQTVFNKAYETFSEDEIDMFRWKFREGRFFQEHANQIRGGMDKAYEAYAEAFQLNPQRLTEASDGYYVRILLRNYVSTGARDEALAMIDVLEPFAGSDVRDEISAARDQIFSSPEERIGFLESQLSENPRNEEVLFELAALHENQGNRAKALEVAERLYEINPNYENTRKLADYASAEAKYETAIRYLKEAVELAENDVTKRNTKLEIAENYQNLGNLRSARQYARAASQIDPNWGQPYLRMASIYAAAISHCTRNRTIDRDDRSIYWLVLDYLDKARDNDPTTASAVRRQYDTYTPVLPSTEDKFFRGWETGQTIRVDESIDQCYAWINETTTVR